LIATAETTVDEKEDKVRQASGTINLIVSAETHVAALTRRGSSCHAVDAMSVLDGDN
jgi:hypothetical protein